MTDAVEAAFALDVLARVCRQQGWALLLRTNGTATMQPVSTGAERVSHMASLDVVQPGRPPHGATTRKWKIASGDLLVRILLRDPADLQTAAGEALDVIGRSTSTSGKPPRRG